MGVHVEPHSSLCHVEWWDIKSLCFRSETLALPQGDSQVACLAPENRVAEKPLRPGFLCTI